MLAAWKLHCHCCCNVVVVVNGWLSGWWSSITLLLRPPTIQIGQADHLSSLLPLVRGAMGEALRFGLRPLKCSSSGWQLRLPAHAFLSTSPWVQLECAPCRICEDTVQTRHAHPCCQLYTSCSPGPFSVILKGLGSSGWFIQWRRHWWWARRAWRCARNDRDSPR